MKKPSCTFPKALTPISVLAFALHANPAHATLGANENSLESDRTALHAKQKQSSIQQNCRVLEIETGATSIKQFMTSDGVVFAVTWRGMRHPDLTKLLGDYFADFEQAKIQTSTQRGRRSQLIRGNKIVVETSGQMRGLKGRAYDPTLIPSGVNINEIK